MRPNVQKNTIIDLIKCLALIDTKKAFTLFFTCYHAKLIQFAMLFIRNRSIAEDTVSEVLIRLWRKNETLFFIENFEAYLYQAVKNEALNHLKLTKKNATISVHDMSNKLLHDLMDPHEKLIGNELHHCVDTIIERLPPKRRLVYTLIKEKGMRYKEVAGLMGISERTVEVHLKIAIQELRSALLRHFRESLVPTTAALY